MTGTVQPDLAGTVTETAEPVFPEAVTEAVEPAETAGQEVSEEETVPAGAARARGILVPRALTRRFSQSPPAAVKITTTIIKTTVMIKRM